MVKEIKVQFEGKQGKLKFKTIPVCSYQKSIQDEIREGNLTKKTCLELLEQMYLIRALEEMLAQVARGLYKPLSNFSYVGPTHLSIGQEATSVGAISVLKPFDYITSSHRGHGDALARGYSMIKSIDDESLVSLLKRREKYLNAIEESYNPEDPRETLEEKALKIHIYRMVAELFGKADGYCRGVGGGMHIADFELGHLGANAIVGGHVPIATGAAISSRYKDQYLNKNKDPEKNSLVLCLAGDGAYSNGVVLESLNLASMAQFKNGLMSEKFGVPIIFGIVNNQYAMSGQEYGEITGVDYLARRAASFDTELMHAEVVDGMNVMAVRDAVKRASALIREGKGPVLLEFMTYRYLGHSLSDPLSYRDKDELSFWQTRDSISTFERKILDAIFDKEKEREEETITSQEIQELKERVYKLIEDMAVYASKAPYPEEDALLTYVFSPKREEGVPEKFSNSKILSSLPRYQRDGEGRINTRLAIREAIIEEMARDSRVIIFGEDIADYGGAFGVTGDLLKTFGRDRVFNTAISEAAIVGAAVGMAMTGLKPIVEIMYNDFITQAMDQIANQAAKWSYMSGGQISVPMVLRTTIGGGRGYAGQHSQSLEALTTHIPGLIVVAPSNAYDSKGLLKSAIRENNPVIFFEHQLVYNILGEVPTEEYLVPIGKARIIKEGSDITIISWSYMVEECIKASSILEEKGISAEIIDIRTLIPLDIETIVTSIKKTNKAIIVAQEVTQSGFSAEIVSQIVENSFDWLDYPVIRLCAPNGIPPSARNLEKLFLPDAEKIVRKIEEEFFYNL
ncbi:MAG: pyruvate dehydrogenase [Actinobacteria bacterium]|nr:pyruvate dehydrogenase [Actinomycetota bacterium]